VRRAIRISAAVAAVALGGCVDGFRGSNLELDLFTGAVPVQAHVVGAPAPGELPAASHFTIYAIQQDAMQDRLFEIARFEVHRIVDPTSPCFIDVGEHVPHPGLHVSQYAAKIAQDTGITNLASPPPSATEQQKQLAATAVQRQANVGLLASSDLGLVAVTSASTSTYPVVAGSCNGPPDQIPPPMCMDDVSNQLRLKLCQAAWKADLNLWEGTDRVLTAPLAGITHGMVNGTNPISHTPVGGAQFFVDNALENIDAYAIYFQVDGVDTPGMQLYFGRPTMPTRGVQHVDLISPINPLAQAKMAVFVDLGQDDVHF
jgi:hypothetical protein